MSSDGQLRRRLLYGLGAVALVAAGVFVGAQLGDDDDGDDARVTASDSSSTTTTLPEETPPTTESDAEPPGEPTPAGRELTGLIAAGQTRTYTVRYQTVDPTNALGTLVVDVWRDGDRARQDTMVEIEGRSVDSSAFVEGDHVRACQRGNDGPWECRDVPKDSAPDIDGRIRDAVAELAHQTEGGTETTIAGQPSRCYQVTDHNGTVMELCVTDQGVPARLVSGDSRVEMLSYAEGVPDGIFTPPA